MSVMCVLIHRGEKNLNIQSEYFWRKEKYKKERGKAGVMEDNSFFLHNLVILF